jgi:pyruvate/2-oxoglutarate dehydrogenase complex dihydrolipoamide dehydrogenase (E3) component
MIQHDIIVVGAGSEVLVAANFTAKKKCCHKVASFEKNKIGGECTHYDSQYSSHY